jgi:DNA adenine methylase
MGQMKPLLKWAGGKRHIAAELHLSFPADWNKGTYIEPFIGGGAMFLFLAPERALIADLNIRLFGFYSHVKTSPDEVFNGILQISKGFNETPLEKKKDFFLELRSKYNSSDVSSVESAILLYSLNKLCFNGLYRENSKGFFNVPFGQKKSFPALEREDFESASILLQKATISNSDFEETLSNAVAGDFVYLDPPYIPIDTTSSFTSYHADGFGLPDQARLAQRMIEMKESNIKAVCSNSDTPLSREVYGNLNIKTIQAPRMVSARASGRGSVSELVITNF